MVDPIINPVFLAAYLIVIGAILVVPTTRRWARRRRELAELRESILRRLVPEGDPVAPESSSRARNRLETLVSCRLRQAGETATRRGFVCCGDGGVTILAGSEVVRTLRYGAWRRLAISDTYRDGSFLIALEDAEGPMAVEVGRADDLVRLVNVAANHSVAVGYLRS